MLHARFKNSQWFGSSFNLDSHLLRGPLPTPTEKEYRAVFRALSQPVWTSWGCLLRGLNCEQLNINNSQSSKLCSLKMELKTQFSANSLKGKREYLSPANCHTLEIGNATNNVNRTKVLPIRSLQAYPNP